MASGKRSGNDLRTASRNLRLKKEHYIPSGQNHQKKQSEGVSFVNSTLKIQCHVVKNTFGDFAHWVKPN